MCVYVWVHVWAVGMCCDHHFGTFLGEVAYGILTQESSSGGHVINQWERLSVLAELPWAPQLSDPEAVEDCHTSHHPYLGSLDLVDSLRA